MANPDDTTVLREVFVDTLPPLPASKPAAETRTHSDSTDRLVFFFSGFDPKGAPFYHRLFRNGIAQRNAIQDETLALSGRHRIGRWTSVWTALWRGAPSPNGGRPAMMRTRVHFMRWDDIVRRHWRRRPEQLMRDYANVYLGGLLDGVLQRIWTQAPAAMGLALFPLAVAAGSILGGIAVIGSLLTTIEALSAWPAALVGGLTGVAIWRVLAHWLDCEWLVRLYAFMRQQAIGEVSALDIRLDDMASRVVEAVEARTRQPGASPLREVMFVGYSTGTVMATSVMARALPRLVQLLDSRCAEDGTTLSMLTLGHCLPLATEWPGAEKFRSEVAALASCERLTWHDYSASTDRASFSRSTPWPTAAALDGYQASPRFLKRLSAIDGVVLRRGRRETHLQYLRPPMRRGESNAYDFFRLVCSPETLAKLHAALRPASDSAG